MLSARQLGAERIVLMGRHRARTDLGRESGATDVVAERGEDGIARVRDLTGGPAPVRAYIEHLLPAVLDGTVVPGKVFDEAVALDDTPEGLRRHGRRHRAEGHGAPVTIAYARSRLALLGATA